MNKAHQLGTPAPAALLEAGRRIEQELRAYPVAKTAANISFSNSIPAPKPQLALSRDLLAAKTLEERHVQALEGLLNLGNTLLPRLTQFFDAAEKWMVSLSISNPLRVYS